MLQQLFVEFLLDATLDRRLGRPRREIARMRQLAALEHSPELDGWLAGLRNRALERFAQADWLVFDVLREPATLLGWLTRPRPPFTPAGQKTRQLCLLTAWAGRYPPVPSVFEMSQVLGVFLASGPKLEKAYEGSAGLLRLVDQLAAQSTPQDRKKVLGGLSNLLDWPSGTLKARVARKLRGLDTGLADDLLEQLTLVLS